VTCTATDSAATPSTITTTFTVTIDGAPAQLAAVLKAVQGAGLPASLARKITRAASDVAAGHPGRACAALTRFIDEVRALSGTSIPARQATQLVADGKRIKAVLAC
jgi:hypothetical protein